MNAPSEHDEQAALVASQRPSKYGAKRTEIDGVAFASLAEGRYYVQLRALLRAGVIRDLELQPRYPLVVNGMKIGAYVADFRYVEVATGAQWVVDVKGMPTPVYRLKKKLMRALYGIDIVEVTG